MTVVTAGFEQCPSWAPIIGNFGSAACIILANWGAAWGTWRSGMGLCKMGVNHPNGIIKNLVAIIMAGVLGIYGLIVAIIISGSITPPMPGVGNTYSQYTAWAHLAAGLSCGFTCLAAGGATGIAGQVGIVSTGLRAEANHYRINARAGMRGGGNSGGGGGDIVEEGDAGKLYIGSVTILSFAGAIGLYGFIVALIITSSDYYACDYASA